MYFHLMIRPTSHLILTIAMVLTAAALLICWRSLMWLPITAYLLIFLRWIRVEEADKAGRSGSMG